MNENGRKKREWVKTAAIVFLSVMLVLTFFSNTIMNYSLPEVATQNVQSGTITAKIRGTGVVESGDPYNIEVQESRKVASVAVKVGDQVEKGAVILYLEDEESEELKAAQDALEDAWKAYDQALLAQDVTASDVAAANGNISTATYRQRLSNAQAAVKDAQKKVDELQKRYDSFTNQIAITPSNDADMGNLQEKYDDAKTAKENAAAAKTQASNHLEALKGYKTQWENELEYYEQLSVSSGDAAVVADALSKVTELGNKLQTNRRDILDAEAALNSATIDLANKELDFTRAETALNNQKASGDTTDTIESLKRQQAEANVDLLKAQATLKEKETELTELMTTINNVFKLDTQSEAIARAQETVDELTEKSVGATLTADIAGTITAVNVTAGNTTSAATPVAVMQPEGKGYSMSFSVTNEQAKRLAVGDRADLVNAWRYDDVAVTLASIKPDPNEPGQKKLLTFDVTGAVTAGQTLNISVGQKSANYDYIIPNSAIREDNNGKFILIVESKSSPLGNRYIATRVDIEVLASDDTQSAISAGLYGYEFVITTSTKPVEAGKQVRLAEN